MKYSDSRKDLWFGKYTSAGYHARVIINRRGKDSYFLVTDLSYPEEMILEIYLKRCQHQLEMWKNINRKYGKASTIFVKSMTKRTNQLCTNKTGFLFLSKPVTLSAYVDNGTVMQ